MKELKQTDKPIAMGVWIELVWGWAHPPTPKLIQKTGFVDVKNSGAEELQLSCSTLWPIFQLSYTVSYSVSIEVRSNIFSSSVFSLMDEGSGCPRVWESCSWKPLMLFTTSEEGILSCDCSWGLAALMIKLIRSHTELLKCPRKEVVWNGTKRQSHCPTRREMVGGGSPKT